MVVKPENYILLTYLIYCFQTPSSAKKPQAKNFINCQKVSTLTKMSFHLKKLQVRPPTLALILDLESLMVCPKNSFLSIQAVKSPRPRLLLMLSSTLTCAWRQQMAQSCPAMAPSRCHCA